MNRPGWFPGRDRKSRRHTLWMMSVLVISACSPSSDVEGDLDALLKWITNVYEGTALEEQVGDDITALCDSYSAHFELWQESALVRKKGMVPSSDVLWVEVAFPILDAQLAELQVSLEHVFEKHADELREHAPIGTGFARNRIEDITETRRKLMRMGMDELADCVRLCLEANHPKMVDDGKSVTLLYLKKMADFLCEWLAREYKGGIIEIRRFEKLRTEFQNRYGEFPLAYLKTTYGFGLH